MLNVDVEHLGYLLHVDILVYNHGVCLGWQLCYHRTDVVVAVIVHNVVGCDKCWYISSCLLWQVGINIPVIGIALGTMDGLVDIGRSTVVGCDDQAPIVEYLVQVAQIVSGCIGCLHRVAALIHECVDLQTITLGCREHELPQAGAPTRDTALGLRADSMTGRYFNSKGML